MSVSSYRDLKVWQVGMEIADQIYQLTDSFPKHEIYGLSSQMQRAAVSIPSNIAEGHARNSTKEFLHHISIAQGSLAELETQLIIATWRPYIENKANIETIFQKMEELGKMLGGLEKSLQNKLKKEKKPKTED
ncbi:four helix bundle protein [Aerosakkonema funiforme]|uniref:Four helix bundle protein n=1 Tax=Aerosakkonema funiforme FACHB-1375 TaxID=2949571 RepID=A0A926VI84_9CYAN|nr:four helix bundle protein [Aerosakkonema funiforme]MBD2184451.1 four helix bundle protein [Aerosakkonema funiforme FACHB-1375]